MAQSVIYASAIDYVRALNDNMVDNALGQRSAFVLFPSLYQRAYALCYETGEMPIVTDVLAPTEVVTGARKNVVNVLTSTR